MRKLRSGEKAGIGLFFIAIFLVSSRIAISPIDDPNLQSALNDGLEKNMGPAQSDVSILYHGS
ncbi:MAG: hypothetical protein P1Q69_00140 [Candidatus Thorarchaeota archaeon]|nr:hypothetical protein [Candidatus Thorarchaeota archaeon]